MCVRAEGVYRIGILMCVQCVNVFIVVEELWEGFETALALTLCKSSWVALRSYFGWRSVGGVNHFYTVLLPPGCSRLGVELIGYSLHSQVTDVGGSLSLSPPTLHSCCSLGTHVQSRRAVAQSLAVCAEPVLLLLSLFLSSNCFSLRFLVTPFLLVLSYLLSKREKESAHGRWCSGLFQNPSRF